MSLQDKIGSMEIAIADLVTATLSSIRKLSPGKDFVLDDKDGNFKTFFLDCAKSKLYTSYNAYVIQADFENTNQTDKSNKKTHESKVSTEVNVPNSLNPFLSEPDAMSSSSDKQQFLISRQPFRQLSDISETQKHAELKFQNRFSNTLVVHGLPIRGGGDRNSLLGPFQKLCDHLFEPVNPKEIENIESDGEILTVTLYDKRKRDLLISICRREKNLKSKNILKLLPDEISMNVTIHAKETTFYRNLSLLAQEYVLKKKLYCHRICSEGLGIKFKKHTAFIYVRSQNELNQEIARNEVKSKRGKCSNSAAQ